MCTEKIIFVAGNTHEYVAKKGNCDFFCSRAPHGARGLKLCWPMVKLGNETSRPARGAWIETHEKTTREDDAKRRAPHGARGLKPSCRTAGKLCQGVCPSRSAWLETR